MPDNENTHRSEQSLPCFFNIPGQQFTLLSVLTALLLINNLDLELQDTLGNFFSSIGQSITTASGQNRLLSARRKQSKNDMLKERLAALKNQINSLEAQIENGET